MGFEVHGKMFKISTRKTGLIDSIGHSKRDDDDDDDGGGGGYAVVQCVREL